mgnify:CR=1 FL=1
MILLERTKWLNDQRTIVRPSYHQSQACIVYEHRPINLIFTFVLGYQFDFFKFLGCL